MKLSDGRKRSMSLWVEFITASGYLSARKIRSRFQTLVAQACDKSAYRDMLKMVADTSEVKLRIRDRYVVQITPAFKCSGVWPRSAAHWPLPHIPWPHPNLVVEVKTEGFDLLSKECLSLQVINSHICEIRMTKTSIHNDQPSRYYLVADPIEKQMILENQGEENSFLSH